MSHQLPLPTMQTFSFLGVDGDDEGWLHIERRRSEGEDRDGTPTEGRKKRRGLKDCLLRKERIFADVEREVLNLKMGGERVDVERERAAVGPARRRGGEPRLSPSTASEMIKVFQCSTL